MGGDTTGQGEIDMTKAEYTAQVSRHIEELTRIMEAARAQGEALLDMAATEEAAIADLAASLHPPISDW